MKTHAYKKTACSVIPTGDKVKDFHDAIVKDDATVALKLLTQDPSLARLSYGRFPVLSLLYMYGSRRLIRKLGNRFTLTDYIATDEYPSDYIRFRELSGRGLRLFGSGYVSPEEMLAVLGEAPTLRASLAISPTTERARRAADIYYLTGKGKVTVNGERATIPHSKRMTLFQIVTITLIIILSLTICAGASVAYYVIPSKLGIEQADRSLVYISDEAQLTRALSENDNKTLLLQEDISLSPAALNGVSISTKLSGDGHTIKVNGPLSAPLFGEISGALSDVTFDFGEIDIVFDSDFALLSDSISGAVSNLKLIASGSINDASGNETVRFGCLTVRNSGTITNVELDIALTVTGASSSGKTSEDVYFAGIAAINAGTISYCSTGADSTILLDTVDGAALVAENNEGGRVLDSANNAAVTQTTSYYHWSPNVAGIVLNNKGTINNCINYGSVTCSSTVTKAQYEENVPESDSDSRTVVYAGGIVCNNYGDVNHCKNTGDVTAQSAYSFIYAGGIAAISTSSATRSSTIAASVSSGIITATSEAESDEDASVEIFVGGIVGNLVDYITYSSVNPSVIRNCFSLMSTTHSGYQYTFLGAVVGRHNIYSLIGIEYYKYSNYENNYYLSQSGFQGGIGCLFNLAATGGYFDPRYRSNVDIISSNGTTALAEGDLKSKENYW